MVELVAGEAPLVTKPGGPVVAEIVDTQIQAHVVGIVNRLNGAGGVVRL